MNDATKPSPANQSQYQVRFDWGADGALALTPGADVVVLVDVLDASDADNQLAGHQLAGHQLTVNQLTVNQLAERFPGVTVVAGSLRNCTAVANWILAKQTEKGDRLAVAIIAAGEAGESGIRFAVEDHLAAGAIIDALAAVGIDYCSPEAAVACASFTALRGAVGHLVSASVGGKKLAALGDFESIARAVEFDASTQVRVLSV